MIGELTRHLWQSTVFAVAAGLLTLAFRGNRAQVRYGLWLSASLKFFIPFALLMNVGSHLALAPAAHRIATQIAAPAVSFTIEQFSQPMFPESLEPAPTTLGTIHWIPIAAFGAWLCGFLTIALIRFRSWLRIQAAVRASTAINIPSSVEVRVASGLLEPGVVGGVIWLRPILLLPEGITERLSPCELSAVLAHELCHVRRRDNLFALIHMIVEAVFWFHPLVWWIGARLVEERERACDEEVLRLGNNPDVYADAILNVCKLYVESPLACVSGVSGAGIRRRIEAIMANRRLAGLNRAKKFLLATAGTLTLAAPVVIGLVIGVGHAPVIHAQSPAPQFAQTATPIPNAQMQRTPVTTPQSPTTVAPKFDAVSIRPCEPRSGGGGRGPNGGAGIVPSPRTSPGRLNFACVSVQELIGRAYIQFADGRIHSPLVPPTIEGMPDWVRINPGPAFNPANRFTLEATAESTPSQEMMMGPMLQAVLEDRFRVKVHNEARDVPAYALTVAKNGPKLTLLPGGTCSNPDLTKFPAEYPPPGQVRCEHGDGRKGPNIAFAGQGESMADFARRLSNIVGRLVLDKTAIAGSFDFEFEYGPDENTPPGLRNMDPERFCAGTNVPVCKTPTLGESDPAGPSIFTVLEKRFGLKLEPTTGQKEFLVIDHVERPSEN